MTSPDASQIDAPAETGSASDATLDAGPIATMVDPDTASEIVIVNAPTTSAGLSDVAFHYPAGAPKGYLTFTAVDVVQGQPMLSTRAASSTDQGKTWTYIADVNTAVAGTITTSDMNACPGGTCQGTTINEVSSIVEDTTDTDPARRWKVLTHRYFWVKGSMTPTYAYGHIALFTAPDPTGPWSTPTVLVGAPSPTPFSSANAIATTTSLGITSCAFLTEPSILLVGNRLLVALGCIVGPTSIRIELLESTTSLASLKSLGTLVSLQDATALGAPAPHVNAAHLFRAAGSTYLLVSTGNANGRYLGCDLLRIDANDAVARDSNGPIVLRTFDTPTEPQRGACAFAEGAPESGYVMNIPRSMAPLRWRVFRTGVKTL